MTKTKISLVFFILLLLGYFMKNNLSHTNEKSLDNELSVIESQSSNIEEPVLGTLNQNIKEAISVDKATEINPKDIPSNYNKVYKSESRLEVDEVNSNTNLVESKQDNQNSSLTKKSPDSLELTITKKDPAELNTDLVSDNPVAQEDLILCSNAWFNEFKDCDYIPDNLKLIDELGRNVPLFKSSQEAWDWAENEIDNNTSNYNCRGFTRMDGYYNNGTQFFFAYLKVCEH